MARWTGLEPATPGVTGRYSNQLSYHRAIAGLDIGAAWGRQAGMCPIPQGLGLPDPVSRLQVFSCIHTDLHAPNPTQPRATETKAGT